MRTSYTDLKLLSCSDKRKQKKETMQKVLTISIEKLKTTDDVEDPAIFLERYVLIKNTVKLLQAEIHKPVAKKTKPSSHILANSSFEYGPLTCGYALLY